MQENWRSIPVETVERVISDYNGGKYPPTYADLVQIANRVGFNVHEVSVLSAAEAMTNYLSHSITIPCATPGQMITYLLHEVAEILLKLPVAAEFHHPLTGADEHHEVAKLVEESRRKIITEKIQQEEHKARQLEVEMQAIQRQYEEAMALIEASRQQLE